MVKLLLMFQKQTNKQTSNLENKLFFPWQNISVPSSQQLGHDRHHSLSCHQLQVLWKTWTTSAGHSVHITFTDLLKFCPPVRCVGLRWLFLAATSSSLRPRLPGHARQDYRDLSPDTEKCSWTVNCPEVKVSRLELRMGPKISGRIHGHVWFAHSNVKAEVSSPEKDWNSLANILERLFPLLLMMYLFPGYIKGFVLLCIKQMTARRSGLHTVLPGHPGASDELQNVVANALLELSLWGFRGTGC